MSAPPRLVAEWDQFLAIVRDVADEGIDAPSRTPVLENLRSIAALSAAPSDEVASHWLLLCFYMAKAGVSKTQPSALTALAESAWLMAQGSA